MTQEQINTLYDSLNKKDMSRAEFHRAYARQIDPVMMREDFARICRQRHEVGKINRALGDAE